MTVEEIGQACELGSTGYVKEQLIELMKEYEQRGGALHIVEQDGRFKLNIRKAYGHLANKLVSSSEFDNPTTKTLAIIAHKHPALQSEVIHIRGNKAYDHISVLKESGLVTSEKSGRTRLLKLTPKFYEYFDTADDRVKQVFSSVEQSVKQQVAVKAGMTVEEVEQKEQLLKEAEQKEKEMKEKLHREQHASSEQPSDRGDITETEELNK